MRVFSAETNKHVVVIVWDGMRPDFISREHTPTLWQLAHDGVMFQNHHPVYPSSTEVNGTAIATGAYPQSSGIIANKEYRPGIDANKPVDTQDFDTIRKGDAISDGHYLMRSTTAEILQAAGIKTAIAGAKSVAQLHDRRDRPADYRNGIVVYEGKALPPSLQSSLNNALGKFPPTGDAKSLPNTSIDAWTTHALTTVLWSNDVPPFSLLWLSEPDHSQHPTAPGSPRSLAALESSDHCLAEVLAELDRRKLRDLTDVFVVSDHGFSTIERGTDLCVELQKAGFPAQREFTHTSQKGDILVLGVGGTTLFYINGHDKGTANKLVEFLQNQDYVGVIFSREKVKGTFALGDVNINSPEAADVVISLRWSDGKSRLGVPGLIGLDGGRSSSLRGSHTTLSRFDMHNTLVGAGPDLKKGFNDTYPTGNTDLAPTILWLLGVKPKVPMDGRVLSEALTIKAPKMSKPTTRRIEAKRRTLESFSWSQYLRISRVNDTIYFDEGNGESRKY